MNLLILGGTKFVGRHITAAALERGHHVTLFNRGKTNQGLFPDAEHIEGDRDGGLAVLRGRTWDAVMDVNGYLPRLVADSAKLLASTVARYVFISTLSVYGDFTKEGQDENAPLATLQDPNVEEITGETYGGLKVLCEQAVRAAFDHRNLILRLGYVVGPHDHTDRWTSWIRRVAQGGEMLAPGKPDLPIQFIDARDVARFAVDALHQETSGIFNVTGPAERLTWGALFDHARAVTGAGTTFTWVDEKFLIDYGVKEEDLPMFAFGGERGLMTLDNRRALAAGLRFKPLQDTIRDTFEWDVAQGTRRAGLDKRREADLLSVWHSKKHQV